MVMVDYPSTRDFADETANEGDYFWDRLKQWSVGPSLADAPLRDGKTRHGGKRQPYTKGCPPVHS
jgi:hypothetical protein